MALIHAQTPADDTAPASPEAGEAWGKVVWRRPKRAKQYDLICFLAAMLLLLPVPLALGGIFRFGEWKAAVSFLTSYASLLTPY